MGIANQPAVVHIAHDVFHAFKGVVDVWCVVHGQYDAGDDLYHEADHGDGTESPPVV